MRTISDDLNNLDNWTMSVGSKYSDKLIISNDKLDLDNLYNERTSLGSKGSDRVVSYNKSNLKVASTSRLLCGLEEKVNGI